MDLLTNWVGRSLLQCIGISNPHVVHFKNIIILSIIPHESWKKNVVSINLVYFGTHFLVLSVECYSVIFKLTNFMTINIYCYNLALENVLTVHHRSRGCHSYFEKKKSLILYIVFSSIQACLFVYRSYFFKKNLCV